MYNVEEAPEFRAHYILTCYFFNVHYQIAIICTILYIPKNYSKKYTFKKKHEKT